MLDVYPAREQPVGELAGVSGLQVARAAATRGGGSRSGGCRRAEVAERARRRSTAPALFPAGSVLVTIGAGDVFRLGEALVRSGR